MATNEYEIGDDITLKGTFTDATGTLTDPTTVTVKVRDAAGAITTSTLAGGTVTRASLGVFTTHFVPTMPGPHLYEFASTGPVQRTLTRAFSVRLTPF